MQTQSRSNREDIPEASNRLGMAGIEFVEYKTSRPQALGQELELMGFRPVARHRSREVVLYRQGDMNLIVNAQTDERHIASREHESPVLSAVAFRVADAGRAMERCLELGSWEVKPRAQAMELHIPGIHGPGNSHFYFIDRWEQFSIYEIDFLPIPTVEQNPPAIAELDWFGVVQYVDDYRSADWIAWYEALFDFTLIPDEERFGILPHGCLMRSADNSFLWQLVAPVPLQQSASNVEGLRRIGLGVPDVGAAVKLLKQRGVEFVDSNQLHPDDRGALTCSRLGGLAFELVHRES